MPGRIDRDREMLGEGEKLGGGEEGDTRGHDRARWMGSGWVMGERLGRGEGKAEMVSSLVSVGSGRRAGKSGRGGRHLLIRYDSVNAT